MGVTAWLTSACLILLGGCAAPADTLDAGTDVDAPALHACPFDLPEAECRARQDADCGWAVPCSEPSLPRAGCLQARHCAEDLDCEPGLVCRDVRLAGERLEMCVQIRVCIPPS